MTALVYDAGMFNIPIEIYYRNTVINAYGEPTEELQLIKRTKAYVKYFDGASDRWGALGWESKPGYLLTIRKIPFIRHDNNKLVVHMLGEDYDITNIV